MHEHSILSSVAEKSHSVIKEMLEEEDREGYDVGS